MIVGIANFVNMGFFLRKEAWPMLSLIQVYQAFILNFVIPKLEAQIIVVTFEL